jgi:large subunit ribosomal protein L4
MTLIKQLEYEVRNLEGIVVPNKLVSISLKVNDSSSKYLLHKAIVIQGRNRRQGTASCKTRSEVQGGGKKPWKQKGTGRARSGSSNSPLWRGGGVTFGPKPRTYEKKLNVKEKQLALSTAFYSINHRILVVENSFSNLNNVSTKDFLSRLEKITKIESGKKILFVTHKSDSNLTLSLRNIPYLQHLYSQTLNIRDLLLARQVIITEEALLNSILTNN